MDARTDTSNANTGSSATIKLGCRMIARPIDDLLSTHAQPEL